jgi:hypothetical protein
VKVWNVRVRPDDAELDAKPTHDDLALNAIEATKDYDPGPYVLLNRGTAQCSRVKAMARLLSDRFNCRELLLFCSGHRLSEASPEVRNGWKAGASSVALNRPFTHPRYAYTMTEPDPPDDRHAIHVARTTDRGRSNVASRSECSSAFS